VVTALAAAASLLACGACGGQAVPRQTSAARPALTRMPDPPFVLFVSQASDASFKHVVAAPLDAPDGARYVTPLVCDRVHFAGSRGVCLVSEEQPRGAPVSRAYIVDEHFARLHTLTLTGPPSRTRVSPDGRRAAITVFETGHSYADDVFSTRTTIVDTNTGALVSDLEQFAITRDGQPLASADVNFWGVTFMPDGNRFFATVRTRGAALLIDGDVDARTARILLAGAECPSLSPDTTHLAFKKRLGGARGWWQLAVVDRGTLTGRALTGDTRSIDDQVEWLDGTSVIYFLPTPAGNIVWRLRTDTDGPPQPFIHDASSPAVVRDSPHPRLRGDAAAPVR
jgi:hypothetical protein